jgi:adenine-specific DNA-methyltransferase
VELSRIRARDSISNQKKKLQEQYFTPERIAKKMAQIFTINREKCLSVLDPCAGVGNLAAAIYQQGLENQETQNITLVERDTYLYEFCIENFREVKCSQILNADFFELSAELGSFDRIILNPPYAKLNSSSALSGQIIQKLGYTEPNIYSAFISFCLTMLSEEGELVAIIPRSFCNGPTFKNFRKNLHDLFFFQEFYLFESRKIFSDSKVLQELIIIKISRNQSDQVKISHEPTTGKVVEFYASRHEIVFPHDDSKVIHIPLAVDDKLLLSAISRFKNTLLKTGLRASTGKVVDFRCRELLSFRNSSSRTNLLYQEDVTYSKTVQFSKNGKKPCFIAISDKSQGILIKKNNYILVRRISFKESSTKIVASPLLQDQFTESVIGIDNHLNYIWGEFSNITNGICLALTAYLSSKTIDLYFRRFSGHTQINAADLNSLPVPDLQTLESFYSRHQTLTLAEMIEIADVFFFGSL